MIDLKFEISGRPVNPRNMRDAVEGMVLEAVSKQIRQKVGACRCPEHGRRPTIVAKGRDLKSLSFEVKGCCDKLIEDVRRKLS
jgi:hypothetical protein